MSAPKELPDSDYVLVDGAAWFTVDNLSVRIHKTDEGVICDIYPLEREMDSECIASTYAYFSEGKPNEP